jgi:hypothetical protein
MGFLHYSIETEEPIQGYIKGALDLKSMGNASLHAQTVKRRPSTTIEGETLDRLEMGTYLKEEQKNGTVTRAYRKGITMNKKRIAREWLYFVAFLPVGFVVVPLMLFITRWAFFDEFYMTLFGYYGRHEFVITWLSAFVPYLLFQLVRSIVWAWKTVRAL